MSAITVGIIANPVSARDIRRIIAHAANLHITDRANMVLRILAGLAHTGINNVVMMPERAGLGIHIQRGLRQAKQADEARFPAFSWLDMPVTGTAQDTVHATQLMKDQNVAAIIVLGGDGTHRLVVRECGNIPIAGVSSGTNNAFPPLLEPTITGLATGLAIRGKMPSSEAFRSNKCLDVRVNDQRDIALVDVAIVREQFTGALAVWKAESLRELFVTFGRTDGIGLSSIAGLLNPISRDDPVGLHVLFDGHGSSSTSQYLSAPLAPGLLAELPIQSSSVIQPNTRITPATTSGSLALDGERELPFSASDNVCITLRLNAFNTINVERCMAFAAQHRLFIQSRRRMPAPSSQGEHHE
ncbi:acetoin catabolism protein X [Enterovibrio norvegicus]|uniref:ATP-NAD kinase family protein n=1 Tax=Enterovibrio norvegicus TaxID=188144 RepID=A0ABV4L3R6_9GAMM|nr:NAD(+)/NADH kinase [Enterovibrio norvegicus]MCC4798814.1 NAD(+)/NADH kinase [Enterovibrio norvegicus]OEF60775.1 acetoin catabolism protein X [Enterovibrio norvegicus]PMI28181.1 acetoin catabolism protein X [Enterovibrio norvegicus]PMI35038.1 acetoin catabolism protein X [Enterovibrio norvegicus]PMN46290.1 acetoin catabolism protein X [Enterovibrio norvegicus]